MSRVALAIEKGETAGVPPWRRVPKVGSLCFRMTLTLRGHIENGRIVVDERVDLPEGTEVSLTLVDNADDLDDEDRARLHAALEQAQGEIERGEGIPARDVIAELQKRGR